MTRRARQHTFDAGRAATAQPGRPAPAHATAAASTPQRSAARVVDFSAYIPAREVAAVCGLSDYVLDTRHRPEHWGAPHDFTHAGSVLLYRRERLIDLVQALWMAGHAEAAQRLRAALETFSAGSGGKGESAHRYPVRGAKREVIARDPAAPAQGISPGWLNSWEASRE